MVVKRAFESLGVLRHAHKARKEKKKKNNKTKIARGKE